MTNLGTDNAGTVEDVTEVVEAFLGASTEAEVRAILLLSVCLDAAPEVLASLAGLIWGDGARGAQVAVWQLTDSPLVEVVAEGIRVTPEVGPVLALHFQSTDPEAFYQAHQHLVHVEEERFTREMASEDEWVQQDAWLARSRQAFYLSPLAPASAADEFGTAFATAPVGDAQAARMWLSTLVLRQESWFGPQARLLAFFHGFRAYVAGDRVRARREFEAVLADGLEDRYQAIAGHLFALCLPLQKRLPHLQTSIALSRTTGLVENELMARNSQITTHLALAVRADARNQPDVVAQELAAGLVAADAAIDSTVVVWDKRLAGILHGSHARALWHSVAGLHGRDARSKAAIEALPLVLGEYREALVGSDLADSAPESLLILNQIASVNRDVGQYAEALAALEEALDRRTPWNDAAVIERLRKTARSLRRRVPRALRDRLSATEAALG